VIRSPRAGVVALVAASVGVALLLAEGVLRVSGVEVAPLPERLGVSPHLVRAPEPLGFANAPGVHRMAYRHRPGGIPRVVAATVGPSGYRGGEPLRVNRADTLRIACLGDSYTYGQGVDDESTWPAALGRSLEREAGGLEVEVINAGVPHYQTRQEVELLRTRVLPLAPDIVLLAFFLNDAAQLAQEASREEGHEFGEAPLLWRFLRDGPGVASLRSRSRLIDVTFDALLRVAFLDYLADSRGALFADTVPGWQTVQRELRRARALAGERNVEFGVVLYPLLARRGDHLATHDAYLVVASFLEDAGIAFVDLEPSFEGHDVDELRVHPRDSHPNAEAHRIAAEAIADFLRTQGWLRRARP
jgi:lysophospholipase L1-like esterase